MRPKRQENQLFQERLVKQVKEAEKQIELRLQTKLGEDNKDRLKAMQKELVEKSEKVKDLLNNEPEIEKLKRDIGEATAQAKLEAQMGTKGLYRGVSNRSNAKLYGQNGH